jgi:hypothetical protein
LIRKDWTRPNGRRFGLLVSGLGASARLHERDHAGFLVASALSQNNRAGKLRRNLPRCGIGYAEHLRNLS